MEWTECQVKWVLEMWTNITRSVRWLRWAYSNTPAAASGCWSLLLMLLQVICKDYVKDNQFMRWNSCLMYLISLSLTLSLSLNWSNGIINDKNLKNWLNVQNRKQLCTEYLYCLPDQSLHSISCWGSIKLLLLVAQCLGIGTAFHGMLTKQISIQWKRTLQI